MEMKPSMEIPLTQGKVAIVDGGDYERLSHFKWQAHKDQDGLWYACRTEYEPRKRRVLMHRLIVDAPDRLYVDHRSHDTLDNRRDNLRIVDGSQSAFNRRHRRTSRSPYKGITFHRGSGMWRARIANIKGRISLGLFSTPEAAARAYDVAARHLHGEFCCVNFPASSLESSASRFPNGVPQ